MLVDDFLSLFRKLEDKLFINDDGIIYNDYDINSRFFNFIDTLLTDRYYITLNRAERKFWLHDKHINTMYYVRNINDRLYLKNYDIRFKEVFGLFLFKYCIRDYENIKNILMMKILDEI